nr:hypothetical protein [Tanacetum cinerariifolium]
IAQSLALPHVADEPASPLRDFSQGEAFPTVSSLDAEQDRELTDLCTRLQRQQSDLMSKFEAQEVEITMLKARVKLLEDEEGGGAERFGDDAPIKGRRLDEGEEAAEKGNEPASPLRDFSQGEAFPTVSSLDAEQDRGEFNTDFHPMVDFIAASPLRIETTDEGTHILAIVDGIQRTVSEASLRRNLKLRDEDGIVSIPDTELFENLTLMGTGFNEFSSNIATALVCLATNMTYNFSKMIFDGMVKNVNNKVSKFLMQHSELLAKFQAQEVEINRLKERVKILEDKEGVIGDRSRDDAPIKGMSNNEGEAGAERISNDSEEIARVLTSMDAANVLAGETNVPTGSGFIPNAGPPATVIS